MGSSLHQNPQGAVHVEYQHRSNHSDSGYSVVASIVLGRWLGRKSNPKLKESVNVSPRKVKFFIISEGQGYNDFHASLFRDGVAAGVVVCGTHRRRDSFIGIG